MAPACSRCQIYSAMKRLEKRKRFPNERSRRAVVKPAMDRVKITLVALLPALWLLASGQSFFDPRDSCANPAPCNSTCTSEDGKPCPSHPLYSPDISARPVRSRLGPQVGHSNLLPLEPISASYAVERAPQTLSAQRESPPAVATSWQFACRAALDPRAPSSVS